MNMEELKRDFLHAPEPESKVRTVTNTYYKTYHARERENDVRIHWCEKTPITGEITLESAIKHLRERQNELLGQAKEYLADAEKAVTRAKENIAYWQERVDKEPGITDETVEPVEESQRPSLPEPTL